MGNQVDMEKGEGNGGEGKGKEFFGALPCNKHKRPGGFVSTEQGKSSWFAN